MTAKGRARRADAARGEFRFKTRPEFLMSGADAQPGLSVRKQDMALSDRGQDFESRYAHDQELKFRIEARRNKLVGLWAAEKLGLSGEEAGRYAQDVIAVAFQTPGDDGIFQKIRADFDGAKVEQSDHQIHRHMSELLVEAENQIRNA